MMEAVVPVVAAIKKRLAPHSLDFHLTGPSTPIVSHDTCK
jgi:hypothetical protein